MKLVPTVVAGAFIVEVEDVSDDRGVFARTFCAEAFAAQGLASSFPQCNVSQNYKRGTLRGLHYQADPKPEAKLVRATTGRVFDVAVDLRPSSPSYLAWASTELDAHKRNAFYIPAGCAHGFLTLEDDCELFYQMSESYVAELSRGVRFDDPTLSIDWPFAPLVISARDASLEHLKPEARS